MSPSKTRRSGLISATVAAATATATAAAADAPPTASAVASDTLVFSGGEVPSVTFYGEERGTARSRAGLSAVEVTTLAESGLPSVSLIVNGVPIPALLDTGSPVTMVTPELAAAAGNVDTTSLDASKDVITTGVDGQPTRMRASVCAKLDLGGGGVGGGDAAAGPGRRRP